MTKGQLDAVKEKPMSEENDDLTQSVFSAYLEEPERGSNIIITFAFDKGFKLDPTPSEVVDYMEARDEEEIEIEMTPDMLANVAGGGRKRLDKDDWAVRAGIVMPDRDPKTGKYIL